MMASRHFRMVLHVVLAAVRRKPLYSFTVGRL